MSEHWLIYSTTNEWINLQLFSHAGCSARLQITELTYNYFLTTGKAVKNLCYNEKMDSKDGFKRWILKMDSKDDKSFNGLFLPIEKLERRKASRHLQVVSANHNQPTKQWEEELRIRAS